MHSSHKGLLGALLAFCSISLVSTALLVGTALAKTPKRQVSYLSTAWNLSGKAKGSIKGLGKLSGVANIQLFFGPLDLVNEEAEVVLSLGAGEFLLNDTDAARFFTGSFVDTGKGKATLTPDIEELREFLTLLFEDAFDDLELDIESLALLKIAARSKAKARDTGDTIKLKFATKFFATGSAGGESGEAKGSFSASTAGVFVPLLDG